METYSQLFMNTSKFAFSVSVRMKHLVFELVFELTVRESQDSYTLVGFCPWRWSRDTELSNTLITETIHKHDYVACFSITPVIPLNLPSFCLLSELKRRWSELQKPIEWEAKSPQEQLEVRLPSTKTLSLIELHCHVTNSRGRNVNIPNCTALHCTSSRVLVLE